MTDREMIEQLAERVAELEAVLYEEKRWVAKPKIDEEEKFFSRGDYCPAEWLEVYCEKGNHTEFKGSSVISVLTKVIEHSGESNRYNAPEMDDMVRFLSLIKRKGEEKGFAYVHTEKGPFFRSLRRARLESRGDIF